MITLAAAVPENKFNFDNHPVEPDLMTWFVLILLLVIFLSNLTVFGKNVFSTPEKMRSNPDRYQLRNKYLRTASTCSILIGLIGTLIGIYRGFILTAIAGDSIDKVIGPSGEALVFLMLGLSIALLGFMAEFICQWKAADVFTRKLNS